VRGVKLHIMVQARPRDVTKKESINIRVYITPLCLLALRDLIARPGPLSFSNDVSRLLRSALRVARSDASAWVAGSLPASCIATSVEARAAVHMK
jgi:hypothetical protein